MALNLTPTQRTLCVAGVFLLFSGAAFTVPYHVPVSPSVSDSYIFGYNNRAGMVLVALGALFVAFLAGPIRVRPVDGRPLGRPTLLKSVAVTFCWSMFLYLFFRRFDGMGEGIYTVDRVKLLLEGRVPYRDFEFAYGALLIYVPAWTSHLLAVSVPDACSIFLIVLNVLGVLELYAVLRWSGFPPAAQRVIMLLLLIVSLDTALVMGSAYTLVRFITPGLLAMVIQRTLVRARSERAHAAALLLPVPFTAIALGLSPEMGVAFAAGTMLYLLRFGAIRRPLNLAAFMAAAAGVLAVLAMAAHWRVFDTLRSFSTGGYNFPLVPAPHLLLLLAAVAITAAFAGTRIRTGSNTPLLAFCSVSFVMLAGGLGRCDVGHAWMDGVGVLLCALLVCASGPKLARYFVPAVLLFFFVVPVITAVRSLVSGFADPALAYFVHGPEATAHPKAARWAELALFRLHGHAKGEQRLAYLRSLQTQHETVDVPAVFHTPPSITFAAPFAFMGGHTSPYHSPAIDEGYYLGRANLLTPDGVSRKVAELDLHPERPVLLVAGAESSCTDAPISARMEIESLFLLRYRRPAVHIGDVLEPLCAFIRNHYKVEQAATPEHYGYAVWVRSR